ncbi:MAG TPA: adenylate/guanylate cyclase domain-containing protein, partial [Roseiflexaceae bacterium]|nr:adenylate/guanylate cyclase domain-containing protein [Roseiflexaceae bacterium]
MVSFLPPAVVRAACASGRIPQIATAEQFAAAVLFADVSGFTALSEQLALSRGARDGAEELTQILNRYFSRMIDLLEAAGGEVVQFSGDALLAVFPASTTARLPQRLRHARQAADRMQDAMAEFAA